ncbi:hypothetical protein KAR91_05985 [Candidatus Pacearchaeota archaeon]|nr:hypothetical protein [Candidatus Pacearchaeota archaeon]
MEVFIAYISRGGFSDEYWTYAAFSERAVLQRVWEHYRDNQQSGEKDPEFMIQFPNKKEIRELCLEEFCGLYIDDMILFNDIVKINIGELITDKSTCCTKANITVKCENCGKHYV